MMSRILKVAQREYIETVKTKTFLIGIFMVPVIVVGIIFFTSRISEDEAGPRPPVKVAVTDLSKQLSDDIEARFDEYNTSNPERQIHFEMLEADQENFEQMVYRQKAELRSEKLDVYVVLEEDVVEGSGTVTLYTCNTKASGLDVLWKVENLFREAIVNRRYELEELDPQLLAKLRQVPTEQVEIGSPGDEEHIQDESEIIVGMMVPFFFMYLMFMGVFGSGQQMLTSIIEEKSSRVMEVLLSALSPFQLMAGKIVGLAGIGLTVISLWAVAAYMAASWQGLKIDSSTELLLYFAVYYILGFFLFSSLLAGIGSICNTLKEAQSLMMPISLVLILPLLSWFNLANNPDGTFARVLSFLPPLTPMVMVLRVSATSDIWLVEILASMVLLAATVLAVMWMAAKVFRTGVLMYGKRPGLREVLRWLRQS
jgi:ABC-2 type transport system permease protein